LPPEPLVLAFDTSAAHCAAALVFGGAIPRIVTRVEAMEKGQAERLLPMAEELLAAEGKALADVTRLVVGVGPGNFTGIRIAVSLVRGLALGLHVPAIGVTGFEALAYASGPDFTGWTLIDAPRGQFYAQAFPDGAPQILESAEGIAGIVLRRADLDTAAFVAALAKCGLAKKAEAAPRPAPFYLRGADAAPPSDPPPVILP
jgi:tRNA threonylcarbamoyl adenosine modification protein YeaZ